MKHHVTTKHVYTARINYIMSQLSRGGVVRNWFAQLKFVGNCHHDGQYCQIIYELYRIFSIHILDFLFFILAVVDSVVLEMEYRVATTCQCGH